MPRKFISLIKMDDSKNARASALYSLYDPDKTWKIELISCDCPCKDENEEVREEKVRGMRM